MSRFIREALHDETSSTLTEPFLAASIQMVSGVDIAQNLARAAQHVAQAADRGARLVVLPEYFCLMGYSDTDKVMQRESFGEGPIQQALANMAHQNHVWLVGGTVPLTCPVHDKVYNTSLLFTPDGQIIARYDKVHLFGLSGLGERYNEAKTILAGTRPLGVTIPLARLALGICYDLRFPELFRAVTPCDVIVLPAAFTAVTGNAHWEILVRARAIENQCYVIAATQGGTHENGRTTHGHAMIVDPWGEIIAELPEGEGVITATIDPTRIQSVRNRLPAWRHRVL